MDAGDELDALNMHGDSPDMLYNALANSRPTFEGNNGQCKEDQKWPKGITYVCCASDSGLFPR